MVSYFGNDVCRINHALKVYGYASYIARAQNLTQNQLLIVDIAALLHDIGIKQAELKYNSAAGKYQELEGPAIARGLLAQFNIDNQTVDRICYIIGNHHSYQKIDDIDFQVLVEADFLVNIYEDNMTPQMIKSLRSKYFKTSTAIKMLDNIYR